MPVLAMMQHDISDRKNNLMSTIISTVMTLRCMTIRQLSEATASSNDLTHRLYVIVIAKMITADSFSAPNL